jgi:uncharacterized membrane protein
MNVFVFLGLRALHVLVAATWIGSTIFISTLLTPAVDASGPSGGQVMMNINRRGIGVYMSLLGVMTVLSGIYLLWHFAGGFGSVGDTRAGIAFGIGGVAGILAGIIGGAIVGRSARQVDTLMHEAAALPEGPAKSAVLQRGAPLWQRIKTGERLVIACQLVALVLMAVGHYV